MRPTHALFALVGLSMAAVAAYISVTGMAAVFSGEPVTVMVAMSTIEAGKIVCASLAYRLRRAASPWLVALLVIATLATMAITSLGVYGFLSATYERGAASVDAARAEVESLRSRAGRAEAAVRRLDERREQLLRRSEGQEERLSALSSRYESRGWTSDRDALRAAQRRVASTDSSLSALGSRIASSLRRADSLRTRADSVSSSEGFREVSAKAGTVEFLAEVTGADRRSVTSAFILLIVLVFDPVAITIVVASNVLAEAETGRGVVESTIEAPPVSDPAPPDEEPSRDAEPPAEPPGGGVPLDAPPEPREAVWSEPARRPERESDGHPDYATEERSRMSDEEMRATIASIMQRAASEEAAREEPALNRYRIGRDGSLNVSRPAK